MRSKARPEDLAILGGVPAFAEPLHVGRPNVGDRARLLVRINDLLDRRWLTNNGPYVQQLEQAIANAVGVKHCVAACNATTALQLVAKAAGLQGEVIVPSFTFVATAHALLWQGLTPIFCDIDPSTHTLDPSQVEPLITPRTSGILGVHLWGRACDIDALTQIARLHRLALLFDAAHAFGSTYRGRMIGGFGDAEVFSFHATKVLNSFEGGAVATNDEHLAATVRSMRNFGFAGEDTVLGLGINGKMSEVSAAMALTSLEAMEAFVAANRHNHEAYRQALADAPGIHLMTYPEADRHTYHYVVLEIDAAASGLTRDELRAVLRAENVLARRYFYPGCHRMEPYRSYPQYTGLHLPSTEAVAARVLTLPTGTAVGPDDIAQVAQIVKLALREAHRVRQFLRGRVA